LFCSVSIHASNDFPFFSFLLVFSPVLGLAGFDFVFLLPEPLVLDSAHAATLIFPQLVPAVHRSAKVSACRVLLHPQDFSLVARVLLALGCLPPRVLRFSPPPGLDVFCRSPGVRRVCLLRDFSLVSIRSSLVRSSAQLRSFPIKAQFGSVSSTWQCSRIEFSCVF
jgi:hypothetical protein